MDSDELSHVDNLAEPRALDTMSGTVAVVAADRCRLHTPSVTPVIDNERMRVLAPADRCTRRISDFLALVFGRRRHADH
jgi:hypothetical protein